MGSSLCWTPCAFVLSQICEELLTRCLAPDCQMGGLGCDNMTVIIVCFLQGGNYQELSEKCSRPSDSSSFNGNSAPLYSWLLMPLSACFSKVWYDVTLLKNISRLKIVLKSVEKGRSFDVGWRSLSVQKKINRLQPIYTERDV